MAAAVREYMAPDKYLALARGSETKHEYFDGQMIAMVVGSPRHSHLSGNVVISLGNALRDRPCIVFNSDLKVGVANRRGYAYPDATVVCSTPEYGEDERDVLLNPLLIVEVLSPSTERFDRMGKFLRYQHIPSFAEYLLIAQDTPRVELCSRQDDGYWEWVSVEGVESAISIPSLDCTIALADIYRNITFDRA